ncbi:sensor histidine kinase [Olivibacter sitiensis]|uniref:sensor histidine kinase n=1 Tax=Olivibacter sitiensis TaxID=376470 RepID=UPI0003FF2C56|nr:sensor histidine kinase [Olivibacter sitiensis]
MNIFVITICAFIYLLLLFLIAQWAEKAKARKFLYGPYVYALSLAVYCSAWTFYGSIGRASIHGLDFLTTYIGPTLMAPISWLVLRKMIRISKAQRVTTVADFVSARYGKSTALGALVTVICIVGVTPYISLQIKAIGNSLGILMGQSSQANFPIGTDLGNLPLYITVLLAIFIIIYGNRHIDSAKRHTGMVAAVAFESFVKLFAFLAAGIVITFFIFNGFGDIFGQMANHVAPKNNFVLEGNQPYVSWFSFNFLSMFAVILLPRQFQLGVVENVNEDQLDKSVWLFPLYLLVINIFVLPVAMAGVLHFQGEVYDADFALLSIPLDTGRPLLALFVFIGGFSAATGMIIVETIALSVMLSNNLLMPIIVAIKPLKEKITKNANRSIFILRSIAILSILFGAFSYYKLIAQNFHLSTMGHISFAAIAQFGPALILGMYWKGATRTGALMGLCIGFAVWFYTLILPSLADIGWISQSVIDRGPWSIAWLRPDGLFGIDLPDSITHSLFWSLLANLSLFGLGSVYFSPSRQEEKQAELFVNIFKYSTAYESSVFWHGVALLKDIRQVLNDFLGTERTTVMLSRFAHKYGVELKENEMSDPKLVLYAENMLAGVIGSSSAKVMISSIVKEEDIQFDEVVGIIKESQKLISLNKKLQQKTVELKRATDALEKANQELIASEAMKDEFLYTVTHELRTPLTSIRTFAEIVHEHPDLSHEERQRFLSIMIEQIERLARLITQVLDLERFEGQGRKLDYQEISMQQLVKEAVRSLEHVASKEHVAISIAEKGEVAPLLLDKDLMMQVMVNVIGNAIKYCDEKNGQIEIEVQQQQNEVLVHISDNGKGIQVEDRIRVFERFYQIGQQKNKHGSGLGLAISKKIMDMHGGRIWCWQKDGFATTFSVSLPLHSANRLVYGEDFNSR